MKISPPSSLRASLALLALGTAFTAQASYELVGVPSSAGTLSRFDPLSGFSLGSIPLPPSTTSVQFQPSTGNAFALAGSWIHRFDYSTGERRGAVNFGINADDIALNHDGSQLFVLEGAKLSTINTSNFQLISSITLNTFVGTARRITSFGPNLVAIGIDHTTGGAFPAFEVHDVATNTRVGSWAYASGVPAAQNLGKVAVAPFPDGRRRVISVGKGSDGRVIVNTRVFTSTGIGQSTENFSWANFLATGNQGVSAVASHGGFYLIGPAVGGGTRVEEYEASSLALLSARTYGFSLPNGYAGPASVIAPEPGTLLALGAGLAALATRRRRRMLGR